MYKVFTIEDSKRKSSRSKADLFELLIAIGLSEVYGLKKDKLEKEKKELERIISRFLNGEKRTEEQYKRADILTPALVKKINSEVIPIYGKLKTIDWIGRRWQEEETLSDLGLSFESGFLMGISLKSTRQGLGTQKNLGYEKLKQLLGLNIDKEIREMWRNVRKDLSVGTSELTELVAKSQGEIKNAKYRFPIIQDIGKRHGTPVQKIAVDRSVELFNALSKNKKLMFVEEIFGAGSDSPLLNAYVEGERPQLYWNEKMRNLLEAKLTAKKIKDKSYVILTDAKPLVRLQASFTNGIGLSAFCERAFIV